MLNIIGRLLITAVLGSVGLGDVFSGDDADVELGAETPDASGAVADPSYGAYEQSADAIAASVNSGT